MLAVLKRAVGVLSQAGIPFALAGSTARATIGISVSKRRTHP